jgi:hypothetical protein
LFSPGAWYAAILALALGLVAEFELDRRCLDAEAVVEGRSGLSTSDLVGEPDAGCEPDARAGVELEDGLRANDRVAWCNGIRAALEV